MSTKQPNKLLAIISNIFQLALILLLALVCVVAFGAKIPVLANSGFSFYAVVSGSMEPTIPVGSVIKVGKYKLDELQVGDIITYQVIDDSTNKVNVVTHRIAQLDKLEDNQVIGEGDEQIEKTVVNYKIVTKGDANNAEDNYEVKPGNIIGKYEMYIPYLGYISAFAQTQLGFVLMIVLPAVILILWEAIDLVLHFTSAKAVQSKAEIEKLKQELAKEKAKDKKES